MKGVSLKLRSPRPAFWCGERFSMEIEVENGGAAAIHVPAPYDEGHGRIRYELVDEAGLAGADLAARARHPAAPLRLPADEIEVPSGGSYRTAVPLGTWGRLPPGRYRVRAVWVTDQGEVASEPVSFDVVPARRMLLALPAQAFASRPAGLSTTALVLGEGVARVFERRFGPHFEEELEYAFDFDVDDLAPARAPVGVVRVAAAARPIGWRAFTDAQAIGAKAGIEVAGGATVGMPEKGRVELAVPAIETDAHDLVAFALHTERHETRLVAFRFGAPVVVVEEPDPNDPEDWDDESLEPGPARADVVGTVPGAPVVPSACALDSAGAFRLLVPCAVDEGLSLLHVVVRDGRADVTAKALVEGLRAIPGAGPSLYVDAHGDGMAVMLAVEGREEDGPLDLVLIRLRVAGSEMHPALVRWPGRLREMPRSAAVAFSSIETERPFARGVVLGSDGVLLVDSDGHCRTAAVASTLLEPPSLLATREALYLAIFADAGPLLTTLYP